MKELFLIRHAEANPAYRGQKDEERELTESGSVRVMQLANVLKARNLQADIIISSLASRGRQTAEYLAEKTLKPGQEILFSEDLYESSVRMMLGLINNLEENFQRVYVVGHNPVLTYFAEYVSGSIVDNLEPCGVLWLQAENMTWSELSAGTMEIKEYFSPASLGQ